jgi:uncharacterized protein (TIGR00725 family)
VKRSPIIGIMGGGSASAGHTRDAYRLGELIAEQGWILLNGGRNSGIMDASADGARSRGGLTIGILPDENTLRASPHISIPVITGMGSARNCINVLTSDVVVACPGGAGTLSEIALALKSNKAVILLHYEKDPIFANYFQAGRLFYADSPEAVIAQIKAILQRSGGME